MKNWKTSLGGLVALVVVLLNSVAAPLLDGKPETAPDWGVVMAALSVFVGLLFAKDAHPEDPKP